MKVLSSGCSFIWGAELEDCTPQIFSRKTWPALWAQENNFEYNCCAINGAANNTIVRRVINYIENISVPDIVIVQWTFPARYEVRVEQYLNPEWGNFYSITPWCTVQSWDEVERNPNFYSYNKNDKNAEEFKKVFIKQIDALKETCIPQLSKIWFDGVSCKDTDKYYFFKEICNLKTYLDSKKIKHIFTAASKLAFDDHPSKDENIVTLMKIAQSCNWIWFDDKEISLGFFDWAKTTNQKIGTTHPLDLAHKNAYLITREKLNGKII